jgi:hypothetical protein
MPKMPPIHGANPTAQGPVHQNIEGKKQYLKKIKAGGSVDMNDINQNNAYSRY